MIPNDHDPVNQVDSLDMPYYMITEARLYKMAVFAGDDTELRRGDLLYRRCISGLDFKEYKQDGTIYGKNLRTGNRHNFSSYKFINFYK